MELVRFIIGFIFIISIAFIPTEEILIGVGLSGIILQLVFRF